MRVFSLLSFHLFVRMKQQAWQKVDRKRDGQKTRLHIKNAFKYICWDAGSFVLFQSTSACVGTKIWYLRIYPFCLIFFSLFLLSFHFNFFVARCECWIRFFFPLSSGFKESFYVAWFYLLFIEYFLLLCI